MPAGLRTLARAVGRPWLSPVSRPWPAAVLGGALFAVGGVGVAHAGGRAAAPATTIAPLNGQNQVRAFGAVQAWTDYRLEDKRWHVVVRTAGQISTPLAVPAGDERLAVDVGPGQDGRPTLAYLSCSDQCRVVIAGLDGSGAQTVPGSEGASAPTISGSRVAWVRGRASVLMRDMASGRVTRLPGVPLRKCYAPLGHRRCERPSGRSVQALELNGSRLALIVGYGLSQGGGNGQTEVRTELVSGRPRPQLVALMNVGEGGQAFAGPSWARGNLFFFKSCPCGRAQGVYRFDPVRGKYAMAVGTKPLAGFAIDADGRRAFQALDPTPGIGERADTADVPTTLELTGPLNFTRTRPPIAKPGA